MAYSIVARLYGVHIYICFRIKSFEFDDGVVSFNIPKLLTLNDCAYRCLITTFDHYSHRSKSFYPRHKVIEPELIAPPAGKWLLSSTLTFYLQVFLPGSLDLHRRLLLLVRFEKLFERLLRKLNAILSC